MKSAGAWLMWRSVWYSECGQGGYELVTTSGVVVQVFTNSISRREYLSAYWALDWVAGCKVSNFFN